MTRTTAAAFELSARHIAAAVVLVAALGIVVEVGPLVPLLLVPPEPADVCIIRFASHFTSCSAPGWPVSVALAAMVVLAVAWWRADVALRRLEVFCDRSVGVVAVLAAVAVVAWLAASSPGPYISAWVAVFGAPGA